MKDDSVRSYLREIDVITIVSHDKCMTNMTQHYPNTHLFVVNSYKLITLKHYRIVFVMKH